MKIFNSLPLNDIAHSFFTPKACERLATLGEVTRNPEDHVLTIEEEVEMAKACKAEVIITGWGNPTFTKEHVAQLPDLKMICHTGGSVSYLVTPDVYDMGVQVISGNNVYARSVAEGCLCYILCALRRIQHYTQLVRDGGWRTEVFDNRGLIGKKIGIIGMGTISRYFLDLIRWFDCEVLVYSSHLGQEEAAKYNARVATLEEIFSTCDVVSIHTSMTPRTKSMVTRELMEMLQPHALLVNTARGGVIDEPAMFELLGQKRFYAALDVFAKEPPLPDSPIRNMENVLAMPHMGGPTMDMREHVAMAICDDICRLQKGEPLQHAISQAAALRMTQ